jgi:hypothetical protein
VLSQSQKTERVYDLTNHRCHEQNDYEQIVCVKRVAHPVVRRALAADKRRFCDAKVADQRRDGKDTLVHVDQMLERALEHMTREDRTEGA